MANSHNKKVKYQEQQDIDTIINEGNILDKSERLPERVSNKQNHQDLMSYADMLKGDKKEYNDTMIGSPASSQKDQ